MARISQGLGRPNVYLLIYDVDTEELLVYLCDTPIPSQSSAVTEKRRVTLFSEMEYYFNALVDNIGQESVGVTWKRVGDKNHLKALFIGQGVNGTVVGSDVAASGGTPAPSTVDTIELIGINYLAGIVFLDNVAPFDGYGFDGYPNKSAKIPKDTSYFLQTMEGQAGGVTIRQYNAAGDKVQEDYSKPQEFDITVDPATVRITFEKQAVSIKNSGSDRVWIGATNVNQQMHVKLEVGVLFSNVSKTHGALVFMTADTPKDLYVYEKGVLKQTIVNPARNGSNIPVYESWDYIEIKDSGAGAPPAPTPDISQSWYYQRSNANGGKFTVLNNGGGPVADNLPSAISQGGTFYGVAGDSIEVNTEAYAAGLGHLTIKNVTDNVVLYDNIKNGVDTFTYVLVAGKQYDVRYLVKD